MSVKTSSLRKPRKKAAVPSYGQRLRALMKKQRDLANRLSELMEEMEEEEDHRAIVEAKKRDAGKPGIPWEEAKKRLGLKF